VGSIHVLFEKNGLGQKANKGEKITKQYRLFKLLWAHTMLNASFWHLLPISIDES
jgi:hypothetical protein